MIVPLEYFNSVVGLQQEQEQVQLPFLLFQRRCLPTIVGCLLSARSTGQLHVQSSRSQPLLQMQTSQYQKNRQMLHCGGLVDD